MDNYETPGTFDLPCAGHVSGVDSAEETLAKELGEEVNLALDDLEDLRLVICYNSFPDDEENGRSTMSTVFRITPV